MRVELKDILPIEFVSDNVIGNAQGDITAIWKIKYPAVFNNSIDDINKLNNEMYQLIRMEATGTIVSSTNFYYEDKYEADFDSTSSLSENYNQKYYHHEPILIHESFLSLTITNRKTSLKKGRLKVRKATTSELALKSFLKKIENRLDAIGKRIQAFHNGLNNIFGTDKVERLNDDRILHFIYRCATLDFKADELAHMSSLVDPMVVNERGILIGQEQLSIVTLAKEGSIVSTGTVSRPNVNNNRFGNSGKIMLPVSFIHPLALGLTFDHVLIAHVEVLDNEIVVSKLKSENTWVKLGKVFSGVLEAKFNSNNEFIDLVTSHDATSCHTGVNVLVKDGNEDRLLEKVSAIKSGFAKLEGAVGQVENIDTLPVFLHSLPGCRVDYDRKLLSLLNIGLCYFPLESLEKSDEKGFYFKDRFATPVKVNFWYSAAVTNVNMVVIGPSGSGKSFMQNTLLDKAFGGEEHIIVMDVGHSYKGLCASKNGKYFDSEEKSTLGVNIFKISSSLREEELIGKRLLIMDIIKVIWKGKKGLTNEEKTLLKKHINEFLKSKNDKSVGGFYKYIEILNAKSSDAKRSKYIDYESLLLNLEPFVDGEESWVFRDSGEPFDIIDQRFIVFSLFALAKQEVLMTLYMLITIDMTLDKLRVLPKGVKKRIAMDEVWLMLKGDMVEYIEYFFRTVRKEGGSIGIITQSVNDIEESDIADAIKANTDIKLVLKHKNLNEDTSKALRRTLGFNSHDLEMMESLQAKEFFVKFGETSGIYINDVSYENELLYSTAPKDLQDIQELTEEYGSKEAAISELTHKKKVGHGR